MFGIDIFDKITNRKRKRPVNTFPIKIYNQGTDLNVYPIYYNPFYISTWYSYILTLNDIFAPTIPKPTVPNGIWSYYYVTNISYDTSLSIGIADNLLKYTDVYIFICSPSGYAGENAGPNQEQNYDGGGGGGGSGILYPITIPKGSTQLSFSISYNSSSSSVNGSYSITTSQNVGGIETSSTNNYEFTISFGQNGEPGVPGVENSTSGFDSGYGYVGGGGGKGGNGGCGGGGGYGGYSSNGPNGPVPFGGNGTYGIYEQIQYNETSPLFKVNTVNTNVQPNTLYGGYMNVEFPDGSTAIPISSGYGGCTNNYADIGPPTDPTDTTDPWTATAGTPLNGFMLIMYKE